MIEFGKTLREAREAKGLTIDDIVKKTHMMSRQIEALEKEDFSSFAAPIYGRGFVKLYCETVGLDAQVMIAEFMDIFNGNREPTIRTREEAPKAPQAPATPAPTPTSEPEEPAEEPILVPETTPYEPPRARYAAPSPEKFEGEERRALPGSSYFWLWRPFVLLVSAALILWLMFIGIRGLYRAMQTKPVEAAPTEEKAPQPKATPAQRQKIVVEPLYID